MEWTHTDKRPTEEGWYWCDWGADWPWDDRVVMRHLRRKKNGLYDGKWHVNHTSYIRFCGPIEKPLTS